MPIPDAEALARKHGLSEYDDEYLSRYTLNYLTRIAIRAFIERSSDPADRQQLKTKLQQLRSEFIVIEAEAGAHPMAAPAIKEWLDMMKR